MASWSGCAAARYSSSVTIFSSRGGVEQQQVGQLVLLHAVAGVDAELQAASEVLEERLVRSAVLIAHVGQVGLDLLLHLVGDGAQLAVMLQRLAGDVEREVLAVHHAAHEVEVVGQQLLALLHDEHVGAVERQALLEVLAVQVVRRAARHEQQARRRSTRPRRGWRWCAQGRRSRGSPACRTRCTPPAFTSDLRRFQMGIMELMVSTSVYCSYSGFQSSPASSGFGFWRDFVTSMRTG